VELRQRTSVMVIGRVWLNWSPCWMLMKSVEAVACLSVMSQSVMETDCSGKPPVPTRKNGRAVV